MIAWCVAILVCCCWMVVAERSVCDPFGTGRRPIFWEIDDTQVNGRELCDVMPLLFGSCRRFAIGSHSGDIYAYFTLEYFTFIVEWRHPLLYKCMRPSRVFDLAMDALAGTHALDGDGEDLILSRCHGGKHEVDIVQSTFFMPVKASYCSTINELYRQLIDRCDRETTRDLNYIYLEVVGCLVLVAIVGAGLYWGYHTYVKPHYATPQEQDGYRPAPPAEI